MSLTGNNILGGASGQTTGYDIDQSLRFEDGDSPELVRSVTVAGNRRTSTWSAWVKIGWSTFSNDAGTIEPTHTLFCCGNSDGRWNVGFSNATAINNNLPQLFIGQRDSGGGQAFEVSSTQAFRDPSAWYHIVVVMDTTQSTNTDRVKAYINGERITDWGVTSWPSQNYDSDCFRTADPVVKVRVGSTVTNSNTGDRFWDGYIAEVNVVDGTALDASYFGETNSATNQWVPVEYTGSYGTNGFYLKFQDSSALGDDSSGNTNDFTATNLVATDQVLDSPTNNFATYNPLVRSSSNSNYSEGNLYATDNGSGNWEVRLGTIPLPETGKWYWECRVGNGNAYIGILDEGEDITVTNPTGGVVWYGDDGRKRIDGTFSSYGAGYGSANVLGVAVDMDASPRTITFYKDNTTQGSITITGDCATGTVIPYITSIVQTWINFGQDSSFAGSKTAQGNGGDGEDFYYTPPTGYKSLATKSFDDPAIALPEQYFNTVLYTGNGSTNAITGVGFAPDFTWIKSRSYASSHALFDTVRGATKELISNDTAAEQTFSDSLTAFNSDGFTLGADTSGAHVNFNSRTYASWNWKAGGTAVSNTDGTITSSVSANPTAGVSVIAYTGTGTTDGSDTVGHGLSQAPELYFVKARTEASHDWNTYAEPIGAANYLALNLTGASAAASNGLNHDEAPTSSVITLGSWNAVNESAKNFIIYAFHSVPNYSKIGSYTGNGNVDGPFIYTGFRPAFVLLKISSASNDWILHDNKRDTYNAVGHYLRPNTNDAELDEDSIDFLSNGFKLRTTSGARNTSSGTHIYLAFAESPFKTANAR